MILRGRGALLGRAAAALGLAASVWAGWSKLGGLTDLQALKSTNLTVIRQQALTMFPRGSRLADAADRLAAIGFDCSSMTHFLPDISAPSLQCASSGRGFPDYPAINVTVLTRNGLISDIEVWNVMAHADSDAEKVDMSSTGSIRRASAPRP